MIHSNLGPSSAHRWMVCAGSVAAIEALPKGPVKSSPYAEEGTLAHDVAEHILKGKPIPFETPDDMMDYVEIYTSYVQNLCGPKSVAMFEERVDFSDWVEGGFGTADAIVINGGTMHVCDLKYGRGVQVDAEENPQGMLYALGAYALTEFTHDIKKIVITIVQPRLDHISEWEISVDDLLKFGVLVGERAEATKAEDAARVAGEKQCRFCEAKAVCGTLKAFTEKVIMADFDDLDKLANPDTMSDGEVRQVMDQKDLIIGWLTSVQELIHNRLEDGTDFEGYKLVEGRSMRKWEDEGLSEVLLEEALGDNAYTKKLLSVAQAEKALGKKHMGELADNVSSQKGKPVLARADDKRPAVNTTVNDFDIIE